MRKTILSAKSLLSVILIRDDFRCGIHMGGCGCDLTFGDSTVDHIVPASYWKSFFRSNWKSHLRKQGVNEHMITQPMCKKCNAKKDSSILIQHSCCPSCTFKIEGATLIWGCNILRPHFPELTFDIRIIGIQCPVTKRITSRFRAAVHPDITSGSADWNGIPIEILPLDGKNDITLCQATKPYFPEAENKIIPGRNYPKNIIDSSD